MSRTLREIGDLIGGVVVGDGDVRIDGVRSPRSAGPNEIAAVLTESEIANEDLHDAGALLVDDALDVSHPAQIRARDGRTAFAALLELFTRDEDAAGIDPRACVAEGVVIGVRVSIGPGACVESGARLGDRTVIGANVYVGRETTIGADCRIMPNVTICAGTLIGDRVVIQSGTTVGADGFGFITLEDGTMKKIPQLGHVEIGDDVEIGANCCIDRATLEATVIGRGTKIDNLVQIGHNSKIGEDCCIVAQVGIAGSVNVGDRCILAGQAGISDHVTLGDGVGIGAQAGVSRSLASGVWIGSPAIPREIGGRVFSALEHLPDYRNRLRELEARFAALEKQRSIAASDADGDEDR